MDLVLSSKHLGHLSQALFERGWFLQGVRSRCCQLRAIGRVPLFVLLSLGPVRFTRAIGGHIEGFDLVHVVVIHAPLGKDISPQAPNFQSQPSFAHGANAVWHSSRYFVSTPTAVLLMISRWPKKPYCTSGQFS